MQGRSGSLAHSFLKSHSMNVAVKHFIIGPHYEWSGTAHDKI